MKDREIDVWNVSEEIGARTRCVCGKLVKMLQDLGMPIPLKHSLGDYSRVDKRTKKQS